jgi:hypothetical protein
MVATMSWSTLRCHYSATDDTACGGGGCFISWRVVTNVASEAMGDSGVTTVVAECWCCAADVVWTTVMLMARL